VTVDRAQTIVARYSQLLGVIRTIALRKRVPGAVVVRLAETLKALTSHDGRLSGTRERAPRVRNYGPGL
jgi:hypothetical protein